MIYPLEIELLRAKCVVDNLTKCLLRRITKEQIAVINHYDIDEEAANGLIEKNVLCVVNFSKSMSGSFPTLGLKKLIDEKIPVYDVKANNEKFKELHDGYEIVIDTNSNTINFLFNNQPKIILPVMKWTVDKWRETFEKSTNNLEYELDKFIKNTLEYATKEKNLVLERLSVPKLRTKIKGRQVLIVIRGNNYRKDLYTLKRYIEEKKPVLIGVDGGADALIESGFKPDIIIGDMDSITDEALKSNAELIVHAYPSGNAPGMHRIDELKLSAQILTSIGTSEDVAMLLAYEEMADIIVVVGSHTNIIDFLEKGRKGMASTLLVRMKIGPKLIDARGISHLYNN